MSAATSALHVAMLRAQGIPARARCGFGVYFEKGKYLDHWVTEYWNEEKKLWVLFDAQIDDRQRELFRVEFDTADVPRDQFVVAGDAWSLCRDGKTDPSAFGILDMHGLWFIAGNLVRRRCVEQPRNAPMGLRAQCAVKTLPGSCLFHRLAILSREPDANADELSAVYSDERVSVPGTVFNAEINCWQEL